MTDIIKVTYSSLDGARKVQRFKTVIGASEWAQLDRQAPIAREHQCRL